MINGFNFFMIMTTSLTGIAAIKKHEGLRLEAYQCSAGVWTVGYGHTGSDTAKGKAITLQEATDLLVNDLKTAEDCINSHNLDINQNQFDALVSLVYNVGVTAFNASKTLELLKKDPNAVMAITSAFMSWNKSRGKIVAGLVKRRMEEVNLYFRK